MYWFNADDTAPTTSLDANARTRDGHHRRLVGRTIGGRHPRPPGRHAAPPLRQTRAANDHYDGRGVSMGVVLTHGIIWAARPPSIPRPSHRQRPTRFRPHGYIGGPKDTVLRAGRLPRRATSAAPGRAGGVHQRDPGLRRGEPAPRNPGSIPTTGRDAVQEGCYQSTEHADTSQRPGRTTTNAPAVPRGRPGADTVTDSTDADGVIKDGKRQQARRR